VGSFEPSRSILGGMRENFSSQPIDVFQKTSYSIIE
jgi:hypothetical protein